MTLSSLELGELAGLISALAWAAIGLLVRAHGAGIHAIVINALRCTTAGLLFLVAWPFVSTRAPVPPQAWLFLGASLVFGLGIGDSLYFEALRRIGVARAMPISMGYPVLAAIGAVGLLHESLGTLAALGIALTLGGVYLVAQPGRGAASTTSRRDDWLGVAMAATAAVSWSCSTLALGPAMQLVDVPTASAVRVPLVGALLWAAARRANVLPARSQFGPHALLAIAATGVFSVTATALFLQSVSLAGAGRAAVLSATSPLFAMPLSVAFLGERGTWRLAGGTVCSVAGVILLAQT